MNSNEPKSESEQVTSPNKSNGKRTSKATKSGSGIAALIEDAQRLRTALHNAYQHSGQLVVALKRHRKQAKIMRSTIAALRQLAPLER